MKIYEVLQDGKKVGTTFGESRNKALEHVEAVMGAGFALGDEVVGEEKKEALTIYAIAQSVKDMLEDGITKHYDEIDNIAFRLLLLDGERQRLLEPLAKSIGVPVAELLVMPNTALMGCVLASLVRSMQEEESV